MKRSKTSNGMKVVEVIPIAKGIAKPTLSYFTKESFSPGQFVRIPVRSGSTLGVVVGSQDVRGAKSSLKGAGFALRKLVKVEKVGGLSASFMQGVVETANFYATTAGSVLSNLIIKKFLDKPELLGKPVKVEPSKSKEVRLVQLVHSERFREYRGIVRESFARGKSVLFIVPTDDDVAKALALLSLGIEQYVFTSKHLVEALASEHPILFVTTPSHIAFDRSDLETIILERENSRAYRTLTRPYINVKKFLEYYAKARGLTLILGDSVLSLETLWREHTGEYVEFSPLSWRLKFPSLIETVNMREEKGFQVFSSKLKEEVGEALRNNKKVFLFALRKGSSPTTVCGDCGSVLLCKNCSSPMVLHTGPLYVCHHCGAKRSAETRCDSCGSWKLVPLGIGIDKVAEEAKKLFPDAEIFVLDKDRVKTKAEAKALLKKFLSATKAIVIGTEMALYYVDRVPLVGAVALDSLFSIPDFGINERVFYLITKLREIASEKMIVQTRNAGEKILNYATSGNALDFYRDEMSEREETLYPPFSLFVKVTTGGSRGAINKKAAHLQDLFGKYEPHFTLGKELSMVMRLPRNEWPVKEVCDKLLLLTPDFLIKVDPDSII